MRGGTTSSARVRRAAAAAACAALLAGCAPAVASSAGALPDDARLGVVELLVTDVEVQRAFYVDAVGLDVLADADGALLLGDGDQAVLSLVRSELPRPAAGEAGLYHSALLYPDEASLAATLSQIAEVAPESYQGASDHGVSQAFYLSDPEGNGVELYVDRPSDTWQWRGDRVTMGSAPLDPNAFIVEHMALEAPLPPRMGHVHLKVGDIDEAKGFYVDVLGFDITSEAPGALFMSVGGYHHHLAVNTWSSDGASERSESTGLGAFTIELPSVTDVDRLVDRLAEHGRAFDRDGDALTVVDPWGNAVVAHVAS